MRPPGESGGSHGEERRYLVGLTGGMASGKSTVARWLAEEGFHVIDADRIVAELYAPGGKGAEALRRLLGDRVLTEDGAVDKPVVAGRIFADPEVRSRVEAAVHPLVHESFTAWAAEREGVVIYEATLLVESGHAGRFDEVITIEAPRERRLEWAMARGMERTQAEARLEAQGDGAERRRGATRIVHNIGTLEELRTEIEELAEELRARAGQPARRRSATTPR